MNKDQDYITATADEAIHYTAGGSTIDWMFGVGVKPFVIEAVPPCHDRWCNSLDDDEIWKAMKRYGTTAHQFIQLASLDQSNRGNDGGDFTPNLNDFVNSNNITAIAIAVGGIIGILIVLIMSRVGVNESRVTPKLHSKMMKSWKCKTWRIQYHIISDEFCYEGISFKAVFCTSHLFAISSS